MTDHIWVNNFPAAITVCDPQGTILEMNAAAIETFRADGGERLIGTNVLDCHSEHARRILEEMLTSQQPNVYTIEKNGRKKLIYQSPWHQDGQYAGFVELSLVIPADIPHFMRD